jgi:hypothetical protein
LDCPFGWNRIKLAIIKTPKLAELVIACACPPDYNFNHTLSHHPLAR